MGYDSPTITYGRGNYTRTMTYMEAYGPLTLGTMIGWLMTGMMLCAAWSYFTHQPRDRLIIRLLVASTVLMCLTTIMLKSAGQILLTLYHPGDPSWIVNARKRPAIWLGPLFNDLTTCTVQSILAHRTISFARAMRWSYGRKMAMGFWIMVGLLVGGVLVDWTLGVAYPVYTYYNRTNMRIFVKLGSAQSASFFAVDVLLTIAMTVQMSMARTGFAGSNAILDSLISITIRNGLAVSICQMILLILYQATIAASLNQHATICGIEVSTYWTIIFHSWIGHLYVLTLISILVQPKRAHEAYLRDAENHHHQQQRHDQDSAHQEDKDLQLNPPRTTGIDMVRISLTSSGNRPRGNDQSEIISLSTRTLISTPTKTTSTLISSASSIGMMSSPSNLRCRACGTFKENEVRSPKSPRGGPGMGERRDSGLIGFRAALMDLEEVSDDSHSIAVDSGRAGDGVQEEDECGEGRAGLVASQNGARLHRGRMGTGVAGDIGLGLELGTSPTPHTT